MSYDYSAFSGFSSLASFGSIPTISLVANATPTTFQYTPYTPPAIPTWYDTLISSAYSAYEPIYYNAAQNPPPVPAAVPTVSAALPAEPVSVTEIQAMISRATKEALTPVALTDRDTAIAQAQDNNNIIYVAKAVQPGAVRIEPVSDSELYYPGLFNTISMQEYVGSEQQTKDLATYVSQAILGNFPDIPSKLYTATEAQAATVVAKAAKIATDTLVDAMKIVMDQNATAKDKAWHSDIIKNSGVDFDKLKELSPERQSIALYSELGAKALENVKLEDKYVAYGITGQVYSLGELTSSFLSIQGLGERFENYAKLQNAQNIEDILREMLKEKLGTNIDEEKRNLLIENYPTVAAALLSGAASVESVYAWLDLIETSASSKWLPGLEYSTNHWNWAQVLVQGKAWGIPDDDLFRILGDIKFRAPDKLKADMDKWIASDYFSRDQDNAKLLTGQREAWMELARDPRLLVGGTVASAIFLGAGAFALKGAGAAMMAIPMAPFPVTELQQSYYMGLTTSGQIKKMIDAGIPHPEETIKEFDATYKDLQQQYTTLVKEGRFDEANKIAAKGMELTDRYSAWVYGNLAGFVVAGTLGQAIDVAKTDMTTWEKSYFGDTSTFKSGSGTLHLGTAFDPGRDQLLINGQQVTGLKTNNPTFPSGDYDITVKMYGQEAQTVRLHIGGEPGQPGQTFEDLYAKMFDQPITGLPAGMIAPTITPKTEEELRKQQAIERGEAIATVTVAPGYKYKDPNTGEWTDRTDLTIPAYNRMFIEVMDEKGNRRYTTLDATTPFEKVILDVGPGNPYVNGLLGKPEVIENAITKITGTDKGWLMTPGLLPTDKVYIDGQLQLTGAGVPVPEGTGHSITVERPGFDPVTKAFDVQAGYIYAVSVVPTHIAQEPTTLQKEYGPNARAIVIDPYYYKDQHYYVQGKEVFPGQQIITEDGATTIITTVPGMMPESKTFYLGEGETGYVGITPSRTVPSGGGGGGGGGGGSTGKGAAAAARPPTTISFGPNNAGCKITLDGTDIAPEIGKQYSISAGYHTVVVYCPKTGMGLTKQVYCIGEQNLYFNMVLEKAGPGEEEKEKPTEGEGEPTEEPTEGEKVGYYVAVNSEPEGAKILIDGMFIGEWTPARFVLRKGLYRLGLYKSGYFVYETPIWVADDPATGDEAEIRAHSEGH